MANTIRTCQAAVSGTSIALRTNAESAKSARSMCRQRRQPAGLARRLPWNMSSRDRRCRRRRPEGPRQQLPPAVLRQRQRNRHQGRRHRRLHDRHQPRSKRKRHLYIFRSGNRTGVRAKRQHQPMVMRTMQKLQGSHPPVQMPLSRPQRRNQHRLRMQRQPRTLPPIYLQDLAALSCHPQ